MSTFTCKRRGIGGQKKSQKFVNVVFEQSLILLKDPTFEGSVFHIFVGKQ